MTSSSVDLLVRVCNLDSSNDWRRYTERPLETAIRVAAFVETLTTIETGVALLVGFDAIVAAVRGRFGFKAARRLAAQDFAYGIDRARREVVVVFLVTLVGIGVHYVVAAA